MGSVFPPRSVEQYQKLAGGVPQERKESMLLNRSENFSVDSPCFYSPNAQKEKLEGIVMVGVETKNIKK